MRHRPLHLLLGLGLLLARPAPDAVAETSLTVWRDPAVLQRHLDAACDAVEVVCGTPFRNRPSVAISTQEDIARILRGRFDGERGMLESTPDENRTFLAYYDPVAQEVHILPEALAEVAAFFRKPDLLDEDVLRIVLVHEATHALDFQRFPVRWTLACCVDSDERLATEAVLEGHAQFVAEEVSRRWGVESAFQRLTALYTGVLAAGEGDAAGAALVGGFDQEAAFTYLQGHAFLRTVYATEGPAGVDAVIRDPPFETRVIDRPILWLEPARRGREPDLQALLEVFRPLVPAGGEWELSKWRVLGPGVPMLPEELVGEEGAVESYVDNHGLFASTPDGLRYLNVFVAYCRSERDAGRFAEALRQVDEGRDEIPDWEPATRREGSGPDGALLGFTSRRRARTVVGAPELTLRVARQGRHVIELSTFGLPPSTGPAADGALDLAARLLRSTPPTAAAVALRGHLLAFLDAREGRRSEEARSRLRDLLPSEADLRRVVRPDVATRFAGRYDGVSLAHRMTYVPNATVDSAFEEAGARTRVRAWAATTEQLAAGESWAPRFPPPMRRFAELYAAPGMTWIVLELTAPGAAGPRTWSCFARMGDRFLYVKDPWAVPLD